MWALKSSPKLKKIKWRYISHTNHFQTNSIYNAPFKRTSGAFGSRLWSEMPLPIDECDNNDINFRQLPEMRRKPNEKVLRTNSLQPSLAQRVKQPLARHISSPMRFNCPTSDTKPKETDRNSDSSFASTASKMSFRNFLRRMSSNPNRRNRMIEATPVADDTHRDKRKSIRTISIRLELGRQARLAIITFCYL